MAKYDQIVVMMFAVSACASFLCLVYLGFMTNNTSSSSISVRSRMLVQLLCFGSSLARASLFSITFKIQLPDILCGAMHFVLISFVCVWWTRLLKRRKGDTSSGEPRFVRQGRVAFTFFTVTVAALMVMRLPTTPKPCTYYKTEIMFVTAAGCLFNFIFAFSTLLQILRFRNDQASSGPNLYTAGFAMISFLSLVQFVLLVMDDDVCVVDFSSIRNSSHHQQRRDSWNNNSDEIPSHHIFQNNESSSFMLRRRLDYDDGSYENVALFMSLMIEVMRFMIVSALCAPDGEECAEETPVRDWVHIMLWEQRRGGQYNNRAGTGRSPMKPVLDALQGSVRDWVIPWSQIKRAQKIKSGGEAQVFKATYHGAGIALKEMYTSLVSDGEDLSDFCQEVAVLKRLHHPFVVTVYGISMRPSFTPEGVSRWFLVMELMASSLRDFLKKSPGIFEIDLVLRICLQICSGMRYLHREGTVHRDLKPENVLVNVKSAKELSLGLVRIECKICDFGLARQIVGNRRLRISYGGGGTVGYRAPELIGSRIWRYQQSRGSLTAGLSQHSDMSDHSGASPTSSPGRRLESHTSLRNLAESVLGGSHTSAASRKKRDHYDRAVDVFSFGVVMYELFTRKRAFRDEAERRWKSRQQKVFPWQVDHIVTTGYRPRITICPPAIAALIRRCWAEDPNVRPAFGDISKQLESVYYRHVESKLSPRIQPHRVSVFKKNQESPRISRVLPPLKPMMEEFHLDARSKIGGPPTSCSQPEQRSLFLRPENNKISLHGIFTGEVDESTKISRSCSPSMFMGRVKPHFSNSTSHHRNPSEEDKETTTTNSTTTKENEAEEEESKEELFAAESYSTDLQTPIKSQNSGLLHEILSTPDDGREKDEDWFHKSEDFDPTPTTTRTKRLITPPKPFRIPTPMSSKAMSNSSTTFPPARGEKTPVGSWLRERGATGISTEPTSKTRAIVNRKLFAGVDDNDKNSTGGDVHISLSEGRPFSPFRANRPKVGEGRQRSYSCD